MTNLINKIEKLQGLEQQATPTKWKLCTWMVEPIGSGEEILCRDRTFGWTEESCHNAELISGLRNLAPAMLEVLSMIHEGDRAAITEAINHLRKLHSTDPERNKTIRGLDEPLLRFQQMAALMEKEEQ